MTGRWTKVEGRARCTGCGALVTTTWRWFPKPTTWTQALCEPCIDEITEEGA